MVAGDGYQPLSLAVTDQPKGVVAALPTHASRAFDAFESERLEIANDLSYSNEKTYLSICLLADAAASRAPGDVRLPEAD